MVQETYESVLKRMRLGPVVSAEGRGGAVPLVIDPPAGSAAFTNKSGVGDVLWPIPITLDIPGTLAEKLEVGSHLVLRDEFFNLVGVLEVGGPPWTPNKETEALAVCGTGDSSHPWVHHLLTLSHDWYVGGRVYGFSLPARFDYPSLRLTPEGVRRGIETRGWARTVAFQTRNPMHRAHIHLAAQAGVEERAGVLIHPVVGVTKPGDVAYSVRVECYRAMLSSPARYFSRTRSPSLSNSSDSLPSSSLQTETEGWGDEGNAAASDGVMLALLPLAMRMAGPREAVWHAIIRKNYGASAFIVGRDHAGCKSSRGEDFYKPSEAADLLKRHELELGIRILSFPEQVYSPARRVYLSSTEAKASGLETLSISGTALRVALRSGRSLPSWFSDPGVVAILRRAYPPLSERGFSVLFTGLSGSGKSTLASALALRLGALLSPHITSTNKGPSGSSDSEGGGGGGGGGVHRRVSLLDGDISRTHLNAGLGFSLADRGVSVTRLGWVAGEIVKHAGVVLAAPIAPAAAPRAQFSASVVSAGGATSTSSGETEDRSTSLLVHVSTPLRVCIERDAKGLYRGALGGILTPLGPQLDLTGLSHPYEFPTGGSQGSVTADITIDTSATSTAEGVSAIVAELARRGLLSLTESVAAASRGAPEGVEGKRKQRSVGGDAATSLQDHTVFPRELHFYKLLTATEADLSGDEGEEGREQLQALSPGIQFASLSPRTAGTTQHLNTDPVASLCTPSMRRGEVPRWDEFVYSTPPISKNNLSSLSKSNLSSSAEAASLLSSSITSNNPRRKTVRTGENEKATLFGGLPMKGSPASRDISGGVHSLVGSTPSFLHLLIAPTRTLFEGLFHSLANANSSGEAAVAALSEIHLLQLSNERILMAEMAGREESGSVAPAGEISSKDKDKSLLHSRAPLFSFHHWNVSAAGGPLPLSSLSYSMDPWLFPEVPAPGGSSKRKEVGNLGGAAQGAAESPSTTTTTTSTTTTTTTSSFSVFSLKESSALYAAYDIWSLARWLPLKPGAFSTTHVANPRLVFLLPYILRLDPCATATVAALPDNMDENSLRQLLVASMKEEGGVVDAPSPEVGEESLFSSYASAYRRAVREAAENFPTRVTVLYL